MGQIEVKPVPKLQSDRSHSTVWIALGLIALNVAIYAPVLGYDFVDFDDTGYVTANPHIANGFGRTAFIWAWTTGYQANWHPLTWMSHMLDVQLFGFKSGAHHGVNLVLHVLSTLLLFAVLRRMTGATGRSAFVAALFAAHPLHVESVAWVAERKDVLSTVFWMLVLWCYAGYVRQPGRARYAILSLCLCLGLLAKPMLVTLPFVLLLLDVWPLERVKLQAGQKAVWTRLFAEKAPLVALALISSIVTVLAQGRGDAIQDLHAFPVSLRVANAIVSYADYCLKMFWPAHLAVFYPFPHSLPAWKILACGAVLIAISACAWRSASRFPYLFVGWSWFLVTMVPVIGLVQVGGQAMADRYSYIPLVGLFVILAWGVRDLPLHPVRRYIPVAAMLAVIACAAVARVQLGYWQNFYTLWTHTLEVTADNDLAENNLGYGLVNQGDLERGTAHLAQAVRINPRYTLAHTNLGIALLRQARFDAALLHLREAVRLAPQDAIVHSNLGLALEQAGQPEQSVNELSEAVRLAPSFAEAHNHLANVLIDLGRREEAFRQIMETLRIDSGNTRARRMLDRLGLQGLTVSPR